MSSSHGKIVRIELVRLGAVCGHSDPERGLICDRAATAREYYASGVILNACDEHGGDAEVRHVPAMEER